MTAGYAETEIVGFQDATQIGSSISYVLQRFKHNGLMLAHCSIARAQVESQKAGLILSTRISKFQQEHIKYRQLYRTHDTMDTRSSLDRDL